MMSRLLHIHSLLMVLSSLITWMLQQPTVVFSYVLNHFCCMLTVDDTLIIAIWLMTFLINHGCVNF